MHRIRVESLPDPGSPPADSTLLIEGDEAHHAARVKRLRIGEAVELLDGRGGIAQATVISLGDAPAQLGKRHRAAHSGGPILKLSIRAIDHVLRPVPALTVFAPIPKGNRADELVEGLSEVGAAAWIPLTTERSITTFRANAADRWRRLTWESAKQCGRAWVLEIGSECAAAELLASPIPPNTLRIVGDASGVPLATALQATPRPHEIQLLIGPEGGWSPQELAAARSSGAPHGGVCRFGRHTMRVETAAVVAAAIITERVTHNNI